MTADLRAQSPRNLFLTNFSQKAKKVAIARSWDLLRKTADQHSRGSKILSHATYPDMTVFHSLSSREHESASAHRTSDEEHPTPGLSSDSHQKHLLSNIFAHTFWRVYRESRRH